MNIRYTRYGRDRDKYAAYYNNKLADWGWYSRWAYLSEVPPWHATEHYVPDTYILLSGIPFADKEKFK